MPFMISIYLLPDFRHILNYLLLGIVCFSFSSYLCSRNFMIIIYTLLAARNEDNWHDAIPVFRHKCTWLCAEQQW